MFPFGSLAIPEGWEVETRVALVEPATRPLSAGPGVALEPPPRATLVVTRRRATVPNPAFARNAFVRDGLSALPGLKQLAEGEVEGTDGVSWAWTQVSFATQDMARAAQRHLFRLDGELLTHVAITVTETRVVDLDGLAEHALSFRP